MGMCVCVCVLCMYGAHYLDISEEIAFISVVASTHADCLALVHTYIHTHIHTYAPIAPRRPYIHTCIHLHTYIHTCMHAFAHVHTYIHAYMHTYQ